MRKIILWMASIVSGVLCASEIYVGSGETKIITVPSGSEKVQSETMVVSSGARLVKDGEGTLTLMTEALAQDFPAALEVREGTLTLEGSTVEGRTFSGVSAILAKAALHLDASDEGSLVCNGDKVAEWLDTRETGSADSGYVYSRAVANTMASLIPELNLSDADLLPIKKTVEGKSGVYFNGYKSGTWMNLVKKNGSQESLKLFNVFVVQAVVTEKGLGTLLGVNVGKTPAFTPGSATGVLSPLWQSPYVDAAGVLSSSRTCINGAQIDPYNHGLPSGVCVIDVEMLAAGALWENIFNDRGFTGLASATIPDVVKPYFRTGAGELRVGGEYVFEIVAFTTALSGSERAELAAYLRQKWIGASVCPNISVETAKDADVCIDNVTAPVSISGDGTFSVASGSVSMQKAVVYTLGAGKEVTAAGGAVYEAFQNSAVAMPVYSSSDADEGTAVVRGGGILRVEEVAPEIEKLLVEEGELVLAAPRESASAIEAVVAGKNGSFEAGKGTWATKNIQNNGEINGWHHVTEADRTGSAFFYNQTFPDGQYDAYPRTSPAGDVVLGIKQDASVWAVFSLPERGRYKLVFLASCRQNVNGPGYSCDIAVGSSANSLQNAGVFTVPFYDGKYHPYEFLLPELDAGEYQLWFKSRNSGLDRCALIDDVRIVFASEADLLQVPNGKFENCNADKLPARVSDGTFWFYAANNSTYYGREALQNWVLTQGDEVSTAIYRGTAPVSRNTVTDWGGIEKIGRFVELDGADDGLVQLYISAGCTASVTFTPPAGTYRLAASAALRLMNSSGSKDISLAASITPGGSFAVDIGACSLKNVFRMKDCILPKPFSVDGQTAITLTIWPKLNSGTQGHLVIDNVRLVPEFVADGDFESSPSCWRTLAGQQEGSSGSVHNYDNNPGAWGTDRASGSYCGKLTRDGSICQDISIARSGLYRLSLKARTRQAAGSAAIDRFGRNPVAVDLIDLGVEAATVKRIALFTPVYTTFTEFSWCMNIPKSGNWRLRLSGQSTDDRTTFIDDVSFKLEAPSADTPSMPEGLVIDVSEGATLRLDYPGTGRVGKIRLGGNSVSGAISVATHPEYISGDGALYVKPEPFAVIIR